MLIMPAIPFKALRDLAGQHAAEECARILGATPSIPTTPMAVLMATIVMKMNRMWAADGGERRESDASKEQRILRMASIAGGIICASEPLVLSMHAAFSKDVVRRMEHNAKISDEEAMALHTMAEVTDACAQATKAAYIAESAKAAVLEVTKKQLESEYSRLNAVVKATLKAITVANNNNYEAKADNMWAKARLEYWKMTGNDPVASTTTTAAGDDASRYKVLRCMAAEVAATVAANLFKKRSLNTPEYVFWAKIMCSVNRQWDEALRDPMQQGETRRSMMEERILGMASIAVGRICTCPPPELSKEDAFSRDVVSRTRRYANTHDMQEVIAEASARMEETNAIHTNAMTASEDAYLASAALFMILARAAVEDGDAVHTALVASVVSFRAEREAASTDVKKGKAWVTYCQMILLLDAPSSATGAAANDAGSAAAAAPLPGSAAAAPLPGSPKAAAPSPKAAAPSSAKVAAAPSAKAAKAAAALSAKAAKVAAKAAKAAPAFVPATYDDILLVSEVAAEMLRLSEFDNDGNPAKRHCCGGGF